MRRQRFTQRTRLPIGDGQAKAGCALNFFIYKYFCALCGLCGE